MSLIYIGLAVVIVLIFAGFGISRWYGNEQVAAASATPTPGPNASMAPIQLIDGGKMGKPSFPPGNTLAGGGGSAVDDIQCETMEGAALHIHSHLALFVNGTQIEIPHYIGFAPNGKCLYWLHTHDAEGIIHIESSTVGAPDGGPYTLGMFFDIWGQPLSRTQVAKFKGSVKVYVNGAEYNGDLRAIPLLSHQQITLEIGKYVPPPNYAFSAND
jgi:hypothetical protein